MVCINAELRSSGYWVFFNASLSLQLVGAVQDSQNILSLPHMLFFPIQPPVLCLITVKPWSSCPAAVMSLSGVVI